MIREAAVKMNRGAKARRTTWPQRARPFPGVESGAFSMRLPTQVSGLRTSVSLIGEGELEARAVWRPRSAGVSGRHTSASRGYPRSAGTTPITVCGAPSISTVRPTTCGSAKKLRCHSSCPRTTTGIPCRHLLLTEWPTDIWMHAKRRKEVPHDTTNHHVNRLDRGATQYPRGVRESYGLAKCRRATKGHELTVGHPTWTGNRGPSGGEDVDEFVRCRIGAMVEAGRNPQRRTRRHSARFRRRATAWLWPSRLDADAASGRRSARPARDRRAGVGSALPA